LNVSVIIITLVTTVGNITNYTYFVLNFDVISELVIKYRSNVVHLAFGGILNYSLSMFFFFIVISKAVPGYL